MVLGEFQRIATYFKPLAEGFAGAFRLGDDAAALPVPAGFELVTTADAMVEGTHFLTGASAESTAWRALRSNLSDLAAMGAKPYAYMLCIGLPETIGEDWLTEFSATLAADQKEFDCHLIGGDTVRTRGPLFLSIAAFGLVPHGKILRRKIMHPLGNDSSLDIYVSGTIGDSWAGLRQLKGKQCWDLTADEKNYIIKRHLKPEPRLALGQALQGIALAAIDISDGLVADIGHIAEQSDAQITLHMPAMPFSPSMQRLAKVDPALAAALITGGEDYELAFVAAPAEALKIAEIAENLKLRLTKIGTLYAGVKGQVTVVDSNNRPIPLKTTGWNHFYP